MKPKQTELLHLLIQKVYAIEDYDLNCIPLLMEFTNRYVGEVLNEAQLYHDFADEESESDDDVTVDDVKMAIAGIVQHSFTTTPSLEFMFELAQTVNEQQFPAFKDKQGNLALPNSKYSLLEQCKILAAEENGEVQSSE